ncbi:hypothetical protein POX_g09301 [Penicillium oxalicum]|uniref:hypothetical protein n=1 Tax=Penicillium oxalicum TaxID=69781 RepID=UPI0020B86706|nr:hypothetical protein POX_g09301 [Penicillium oxalicum]KAI2786905.1 hypothetical protein POX_g09301 [Penicillium oxalicum]
MATSHTSLETLLTAHPTRPTPSSSEFDMQHAFLTPDSRAATDVELADLESPPSVLPKLPQISTRTSAPEGTESSDGSVTLVRRRGRFRLLHQRQYENSLLAGVGYLELANAADFAANVWNQIPVPRFAAVLMGIGGTCALRNAKLLRAERERLQHQRAKCSSHQETAKYLQSRIGVNTRELGTEVVDRIVMDLLMGFGSMLVGVGTWMAVGGANHRVFIASNLLSGYIGNGLAALFGLINGIWSGYLIHRFQQQLQAVRSSCPDDEIKRRLHYRLRQFQWHSTVNGINGLVAGAASRRWSLRSDGGDTPLFDQDPQVSFESHLLIEDLQLAISMQHQLAESHTTLPSALVDVQSLESILRFLETQGMMENYSKWLTRDKKTKEILSEVLSHTADSTELTISVHTILQLSTKSSRNAIILKEHACRFIRREGKQFFIYRERYLLEVLSFAIWQDQKLQFAENKAEILPMNGTLIPPSS